MCKSGLHRSWWQHWSANSTITDSPNPKAHIRSYSGGSPNHFIAFEHHSALSLLFVAIQFLFEFMENFMTGCEACCCCCWWFIVRSVMVKRLWASRTAPTLNIWLRWCVKGVKRRRERGREKTVKGLAKRTAAFLCFFLWPFRKERTEYTLPPHYSEKAFLPAHISGLRHFLYAKKNIMSVQQKPIGGKNLWMSNRMSHSNSGLDSSCGAASSVKMPGFKAEEWRAKNK